MMEIKIKTKPMTWIMIALAVMVSMVPFVSLGAADDAAPMGTSFHIPAANDQNNEFAWSTTIDHGISIFDASQNKFLSAPAIDDAAEVAISGDKIAWTERDNDSCLAIYDQSARQTIHVSAHGVRGGISLSGDILAWEDSCGIHAYNLASGADTYSAAGHSPDVFDGKVVYVDDAGNIAFYDTEKQICTDTGCSGESPKLRGNEIFYLDNDGCLVQYDLGTQKASGIGLYKPGTIYSFYVSPDGKTIVYDLTGTEQSGVYVLDFTGNRELNDTKGSCTGALVVIAGDKAVWKFVADTASVSATTPARSGIYMIDTSAGTQVEASTAPSTDTSAGQSSQTTSTVSQYNISVTVTNPDGSGDDNIIDDHSYVPPENDSDDSTECDVPTGLDEENKTSVDETPTAQDNSQDITVEAKVPQDNKVVIAIYNFYDSVVNIVNDYR